MVIKPLFVMAIVQVVFKPELIGQNLQKNIPVIQGKGGQEFTERACFLL